MFTPPRMAQPAGEEEKKLATQYMLLISLKIRFRWRPTGRVADTVAVMASRHLPLARSLLLFAGAVGYSAAAVATAPWTVHSAVFTAVPAMVLLGYALHRGWHRSTAVGPRVHLDRTARWALAVWALLFTALGVWILSVQFSSPRPQYPTLSYLMNGWFDNYAVRVGGFLAWLGLGWWLVRR